MGEEEGARGEASTGPLTELAFPPVEQRQLQKERTREARGEEALRESQRTAAATHEPAGELSEVTAAPAVERVPSRHGPWESLESAESRVAGAPSPSSSPPPAGRKKLSDLATKLYTVSYLIFFSFFGALARVGLQALTYYPGAPVTTGVLWANVGGSLLMGFFAEDRNIFREELGEAYSLKEKEQIRQGQKISPQEALKRHKTVKKSIPLYVGLTTGFCGCFTSFSTFMVDAFLALSNDLPNPNTSSIASRNGGYSFMAVVAVILYTLALSLASLTFGGHMALALDRYTPTFPFKFIRYFLDRIVVVLAFGCWLGSIFLALWPPDRHEPVPDRHWRGRAVFAVVFAPVGCLFRYYVSVWLNARIPTFPLGTFVANMVGTLVIGMCFDLQHARTVVGMTASSTSYSRLIGCQVLSGVMDGFCGCATTVSTWVAELHSLELKHAYRYGIVSVALGLGFLVVIIGSMGWTVGLANPIC